MNNDKNDINNVLKKISIWNKWDLHIHTPVTNNMVQNDYKNPNLFSPSEFVTKMYANDIKLGVITDHNVFDSNQFKLLITEIEERNRKENKFLTLLPGVELNVSFPNEQEDSIHFILIFDDKEDLNKIEKAIEDLNSKSGFTKNNPKDASIEQITEAFCKFNYIVSIHLGKSSNSPKDDNYEEFLKLYVGGYIDVCENNPGNKIKNKVYLENKVQELTGDRKDSLFIVGSDNHDISNYPMCENNPTPPKITFYKAIPSFEGLKMVITEYSRIYNSDSNSLPDYINSTNDITKIEALRIEGTGFNNTDIYFGRELNSIIGARTSGKSLLINILKYALSNAYDESKYENYISNLRVKIKTFDDKIFKDNSSVQIEVFDQNRLMEEFDKSKNKTDFFKDTYISKTFDDLTIQQKIIKDSFETEISQETDFLNKLEQLKISIDSFKLPNVYLKSYINLGKNTDDMSKFYLKVIETKKFENILTNYEEKEIYLKTSIDSLNTIIENDKYEFISNETSLILKKLIEEFEEKLENVEKKLKSIKAIKLLNITQYKPFEVDEKFYDSHKSFLKNVGSIAKIRAKLKKIENSSTLFKNRKFKVNNEEKYEKTKLVQEFTFICSIDYDVNFLTKDADPKHIVEKCFYADDIKDGWIDLVKKVFLKKLKTESLFKNSNTVDSIVQEILKEIPKPYKTIVDSKGIDINNTSPGNRASILITVILENQENKILIIDQPEDNLDSKFIYNEIVSRLKTLKTTRQIFLVTHNANIVVNSDSENVICCKNINNKISYEYGAIEYSKKIFENYNMKEFILDNLEGTEKAFKTRSEKYFLKGVELNDNHN